MTERDDSRGTSEHQLPRKGRSAYTALRDEVEANPQRQLTLSEYETLARIPWRGGEPTREPLRRPNAAAPTKRIGIRVSPARYVADTGSALPTSPNVLLDPIVGYEVLLSALSPRARALAEATAIAAGDGLTPGATWLRSRQTRRELHGSPGARIAAYIAAMLDLDEHIEQPVPWPRMYDRETPEEYMERVAGWIDEGLHADVIGQRASLRDHLTTREAASRLGITPGRVRQLAAELGVGQKFGRELAFSPAEVDRMRRRKITYGPAKARDRED